MINFAGNNLSCFLVLSREIYHPCPPLVGTTLFPFKTPETFTAVYLLHIMQSFLGIRRTTVYRESKIKLTFEKYIQLLVENARKFRESAPDQISIFRGGPPPVGVSENVWFCMV